MHDRGAQEAHSLAPIVAFYALACAISWGWAFSLVAAGDIVRRGHGWPTHFPALFGPTIAALVVTAWVGGRGAVANLARRVVRWRFALRWWTAALSPVAFLACGLAVAAFAGRLPSAHQFGLYTGWPAIGIVGAALGALVNGLGEETGWRGFLLPALRPRYGARRAAFVVGGMWAFWHLPFFFLLTGYRGFAPFALVGFVIGIAAGSVVATWLYYGSGQSILAVAMWHAAYNMAAGTAASSGTVAAVASALVIVQAILLLRLDDRARRHRMRPILGPRADARRP